MSIKHYILRLDKTNNPCKIFKNKQSVKAKKKNQLAAFLFRISVKWNVLTFSKMSPGHTNIKLL